MDYVQGRKITALGPLARLEMKGAPLAEELFKAYLKQVLVDGLFHADPHPGNVFLTDDGRIALLDLGMVGHTTPGMQENLLKLLLAISEGKSEEAADLVIRISQTTEEFNQAEFRRRIGQLMASRQDQGLQQINVGKSLLEVSRNAADNGLFVPSELTLLGKTLLQLDEVGKILDPAFDPNASIRRNVGELMSQRMRKNATPGSVFSSLLEMKDFVGGLPSRLNRIMDAITNHELEVKVKAVDAKMVVEGIPEDRQSHHDGHRPGRADHGSVAVDAGPNQLSHLWLSRSGHSLLSGRGGGRVLAGDQHLCARPQKPEEMNRVAPSSR